MQTYHHRNPPTACKMLRTTWRHGWCILLLPFAIIGAEGQATCSTDIFGDPDALFSQEMFDEFAPAAVSPYTYLNFCTAVQEWNDVNPDNQIFETGTWDDRRNELAAFLGNTLHETDFVHTRELSQCADNKVVDGILLCKPNNAIANEMYVDPYCDAGNPNGCACPANGVVTDNEGYIPANSLFFGRGAMQLSWNYNYLAFENALNGPNPDFCAEPDQVARNDYVWSSAFYFWMLSSPFGKTCHSSILEDQDFGGSLNIINGGNECPATSAFAVGAVKSRLNDYCKATKVMGLASIMSLDGCDGLSDRFEECQEDGTCPECEGMSTNECKTCSINPDPHYTIWDNVWYDFQGGCDQYAIDNPVLQVQIRTRPRNFYSTITQIAVQIKASGEVFRVNIDGQVENSISSGYSLNGSTHRIDLQDNSYILVHQWSSGLSLQVQGCEAFFAGSEGMCGSYDFGGVRLNGGAPFDPPVGSDQNDLAASWQIDLADNLLWSPSSVCDFSPNCGPTEMFECDESRRHLQANPGCTRACSDIGVEQFREQCERDFQLTGDSSWACEPNYVNPVISGADPPGTGEWYVSWHDEHCLNDGQHQFWNTIYGSAGECCQSRLSYKSLGWCEATSRGNSYLGSGKFYADGWACSKDCAQGGPLDADNDCAGIVEDSWVTLHATISDCCEQEFWWQNVNECSGIPETGTNQWYVDWVSKKCIQDCIGAAPCGGIKKFWDIGHATAESCCNMLPWVPQAYCLGP